LTDDKEEKTADMEIEITNGKKVTLDLDHMEWIIIMCGASLFAWVTGLML